MIYQYFIEVMFLLNIYALVPQNKLGENLNIAFGGP